MTLQELEALARSLPEPLPEMWPSSLAPRGTWFEFDYAPPLAPVVEIRADGSVVRETKRVAVVNADEWREALRQVATGTP